MKYHQDDEGFPCRITFRLTGKEQKRLDKLLEKSSHRSLSGLIREMLFQRKVTVLTYDRTLDKVMEELSLIRKELHAIGININQVTRWFHTENRPDHVMEIAKLYEQAGQKVSRLFSLIEKLSEKWLPE